MATWASSTVLDGGLTAIKTNVIRMALLSAYTAGDSASTVNSNTLAYVAMVTGDFTLSSSGLNRLVTATTNGKSAVASATAASPNLHIAFTDGVATAANVYWVVNETSDQPITSGNTVNFPTTNPTYTSNQPT